jgi:hypothetical protein
MFKLKVTEPTLFDTQEPDLRIDSPTDGSQIVINGTLAVRFTANDPDKDGVGTGVTSVAASIRSSGGAGNENITSYLSVDPSPSLAVPVPAGTDVDAAVDIQMQEVGSYMLIVEATDGADNTATRAVSFTVKATPVWLPPVSMSGRQFKSGSTVPVKWTFTDANEAFLPPYASIKAKISGSTDSGPTAVTAVAGSGASNIRWELDSAGHATQYIVNFPIPATAFGTYTVTIFVEDVDGNEWAEQGTYKFVVSPKGGKM